MTGLPKYAHVMLDELGVEEWPGEDSNPRILEYIDCTPLGTWSRTDANPWCGAFVSWGITTWGTRPPPPEKGHRAREWMRWGRKAGPDELLGSVCVVQLKRRTKRSRRATGSARGGYHVGVVTEVQKRRVQLISGNKDDRVGIDWYPLSRWTVRAYRVPG